MKLATLRDGTRSGELVVVSRDLSRFVKVPDTVASMQEALDRWDSMAAPLRDVYHNLNSRAIRDAEPFDQARAMSPLPRAYQWADASAYVNHVELLRKARGADLPESFWTEPLMYQGGSDGFLGPRDDIRLQMEDWGIDFEAEIAIVTDDVPMGTSADTAGANIKLIMLANDVSLRNLIPGELAKGFGFFQSKPAGAFSPVAVTPDELGDAWDGAMIRLPLVTHLNGTEFGRVDCHVDMTFDFPALIAHAAKTRALSAGTIIGSGTVSNYDRSKGSSCIAEKRVLEAIEHGAPRTPFMRFGDHVRIEMFDSDGKSIFGAIDQHVRAYKPHH
ncbi:MAG: fumarylacetoacetate hydrolase family protein [Alphaproteobacteria bacterium]|nr:fumarylacetoacetate hydrolase family protein [Alphaproteobacteria bacterium]